MKQCGVDKHLVKYKKNHCEEDCSEICVKFIAFFGCSKSGNVVDFELLPNNNSSSLVSSELLSFSFSTFAFLSSTNNNSSSLSSSELCTCVSINNGVGFEPLFCSNLSGGLICGTGAVLLCSNSSSKQSSTTI